MEVQYETQAFFHEDPPSMFLGVFGTVQSNKKALSSVYIYGSNHENNE